MRKTAFLGLLISIAACKTPPPPAQVSAPAQPEYAPTATIKEIMLSIVDPSADVVWLSVTTVQSAAGTVDSAPKNEEEWQKVRQGAVALTEAANLLVMPGRHVAHPGEKSEVPAGVRPNRGGHGVPPEVVETEVGASLKHVRTIRDWAPTAQPASLYLVLFRKS